MKIRQGFVSNSSSSSFVILGTKLSAAETKKYYEKMEENDYRDPVKGLETAGGEGAPTVLGLKERVDEEDYGVNEGFVKEDFDRVEKLLRKYFGPDRKLNVKIYYGVEAS